MSRLVYKICTEDEWEAATWPWAGSALDTRDGFIHLSTRDQVAETLRLYYAGVTDLRLLTVAVDRLRPRALRDEPSRGGALFPHLYGRLPREAIVASDPGPLGPGGRHLLSL